MKKMLMCILVIAMTVPALATDIMVQPGENTIKAALVTAAAGDRLILEQEGVYANDPLFIYVPLTIKAAEGLTSKPVISFLWNADTAVAQTQEATLFFTYASLTVADIELTMDGEPEAKTTRMFRNRANVDVNWKFYNLDMHHAHQLTMSVTGVPDTLILADGSMFFDGIDYVDNAGVFIDGVQVAADGAQGVLDTLIFDGCNISDLDGTGGRKINHSDDNRGLRYLFQFTNSSVWNTTNSAIFLKMQDPDGIADGRVIIDHSTFDHIGIPGENHDGFVVKFASTDSYVKNSTFTNVADEPCKTTGGTTTSAVAVDYCNWFNNGIDGVTPVGGTQGANNLQLDPLFVDADNGDLTLQAGSPLIGAGEGGTSIGDPRWAPTATPVDPTSTFTTDVNSGDAPLTVTFTNTSDLGSGTLVSYAWTFGDGGTSSDENPVYEYTTHGVYNAVLVVETSVGSSTSEATVITVNEVVSVNQQTLTPDTYSLSQNYPNPFNPSTSIEFGVPEQGQISILIYNDLGQLVRTLGSNVVSSGFHTVTWDGTDNSGAFVPSGVYIYQLSAPGVSLTNKMVLMK
ncbi:MAG: DUF5123 domain-containing protein [FCB group bacterium]|nr:DUF5123 domain-containing protein [FCB group bacterium]MBL7120415.1 DUF5123 domain-containing protein [Candidatus Neomarinimicrobiota bacterium]